MPHNLYLHSCLVQSRRISKTFIGRVRACRFNLLDSILALNLAFFVNAAILIVAAAIFHSRQIVVTEIQQAFHLLEPILGTHLAPIAFGVALLAAGQSSTITGTISGQVVMEGFLNIRIRPWLRRFLTRAVALIPAIFVIAIAGDSGTYKLLIFSQVILSLQLPFAIIPLIHFTSDEKKMGLFVNNRLIKIAAWIVAAIIVALNVQLICGVFAQWVSAMPLLWLVVVPVAIVTVSALAYVTFMPLFGKPTTWKKKEIEEFEKIGPQIKPVAIKHIGIAIEHSDGDSKIISAGLSLAKSYNSKITLVHVVDTPGATVYGSESQSLHGSSDKSYLEKVAEEIEERDFEVATDLRFGIPSEQIIKAVKQKHFDLLVLGSHGHRMVGDFVYGQTVDNVRHAIDIPVFVVRTIAHEPAQ